MSEILIQKFNETYLKVTCERSVASELSDYFSFQVDGYQFMPAFKTRLWDGFLRMYSLKTNLLYAGLYWKIQEFCERSGYSISEESYIPETENITIEKIEEYSKVLKIASGGREILLRDYQLTAVKHILENKRAVIESATSSGKSAIIYMAARYLLGSKEVKKILMIFPTSSLTMQIFSDFKDYSGINGWKVEEHCHMVFSGQEKDIDRQITFSTWQSIYKNPPSFFNSYDAIFIDETHLCAAKSLSGIMEKATNVKYRIGLTGTLQKAKAHALTIQGLLGKSIKISTTAELMKTGNVADLKITCLLLNHPAEIRKFCNKIKYQDEIAYLIENEKRNKFISNLAKSLKGNVMILFTQLVQGEALCELLKDRNVYFIHGGVSPQQREKMRLEIEKSDDAIAICSYGTTSTGVSIKRLHHVIFASPSKSEIRVLQSLGRGLRIGEGKSTAKLWDIADNLSWKSKQNHTLKHFQIRVELYASEKFSYKIVEYNL
jgi:superfamily II DNA or RNA helicase